MHMAGYWEFPGGKIEMGESYEECILREIKEELNIEISINGRLPGVHFTYPEKSIHLLPFICNMHSGAITLKDHSEYKWIEPESWSRLNWAPADIKVIAHYLKK